MIFADKLITLRKKNGWSQEDLAEKMQVSRQAVSKWEGAQAVPDLNKILELSRLFGVTTDYLLKEEIEDETSLGPALSRRAEGGEGQEGQSEHAEPVPSVRVSLAFATEYLSWKKRAAKLVAAATFLCVVAVIPLLILFAAAEEPSRHVSENLAAGVGLSSLLMFVAVAVGIFVFCSLKNTPFKCIEEGLFEAEQGVENTAKDAQRAFRPAYIACNIVGACLCVFSPIPLFVGAATEREFFTVVMLAVTLLLAGGGAALFTFAGVRYGSLQKLLKDDRRAGRKKDRVKETIAAVYWLLATAAYLLWSFLTNRWEITWVLWPVAAILFAAAMFLFNLFTDKPERER